MSAWRSVDSRFLGLASVVVFLACGQGSQSGSAATGGSGGHASGTAGQAGAGQSVSGGAGGPSAGGAGGGSVATGPLVADFIGLNGFIDDDLSKLAAVGNVREYHDWSWNEGNGAAGYRAIPTTVVVTDVAGAWDFDAYYGVSAQAKASRRFRASKARSTSSAARCRRSPPAPT